MHFFLNRVLKLSKNLFQITTYLIFANCLLHGIFLKSSRHIFWDTFFFHLNPCMSIMIQTFLKLEKIVRSSSENFKRKLRKQLFCETACSVFWDEVLFSLPKAPPGWWWVGKQRKTGERYTVRGRRQFRKKLMKLKWQDIRIGYQDFVLYFTRCALVSAVFV